jgi:kynureninase
MKTQHPNSSAWSRTASKLDAADTLKNFRDEFSFPMHDGRDVTYFCGNSLGLQPKRTQEYVIQELEDWRTFGVEGHFKARNPWYSYHRWFAEPLARIVGALPHEVVAMNSLTSNLHLAMVSFYRPTPERNKIIISGYEFPSDRYAVESQIRVHGFDPADALIEIQPAEGTSTLTTEQICDVIKEHGSSVALVMLSGVHFYTGQRFEIQQITACAKSVGASMGLDLAHAIGNVELELHDWGVDFAVWCTYKYLNAGPGAVGGLFIHETYADRPDLPRFAGWWGNDEARRFTLQHNFVPTYGADGWQLSNAPVMNMVALRASLEIFQQAGFALLCKKREELSIFLHDVVSDVIADYPWARIISPSDPKQRGAQVSVAFDTHGRAIFDALIARGFVVDWRAPYVIRIAPVPLYNRFADIVELGNALTTIMQEFA